MSVRIRRISLPQEPFMSTCFSMVSCQAIIVGPSMKKEGLQWKIIKKGMMTTILISVILSWRMLKGKQKGKVKKRHMMSLLMILVGPLLMQGETAKLKNRGRIRIAC
jgi:cytochrome bd-type quinol oxidase subunit 1